MPSAIPDYWKPRRRKQASWLLKALVPAAIVAAAGGALKEWADGRARDAKMQSEIDHLYGWVKSISHRTSVSEPKE